MIKVMLSFGKKKKKTYIFFFYPISIEFPLELMVFIFVSTKAFRWFRWPKKKIHLQFRRPGYEPWVGQISWRREWLHTPVFLPGKSQGQRRLAGYSPWDCKESDTAEPLTPTHCHWPVHCLSSRVPSGTAPTWSIPHAPRLSRSSSLLIPLIASGPHIRFSAKDALVIFYDVIWSQLLVYILRIDLCCNQTSLIFQDNSESKVVLVKRS